MRDLDAPELSPGPVAARGVCVYCGSGSGRDPVFAHAARTLGSAIAAAGLRLVYGGSANGLMGETARAVLSAGGHVTGVIPDNLVGIEPPLRDVQELLFTATLHERKMLMYERSDAFIALPGGLGTLEELVEQLTWAQLRHHDKPVVIANVGGYWDRLLQLFAEMEAESFIRPGLEARFLEVRRAEDVVPAIQAFWAARGAHPQEREDAALRLARTVRP
ncbi:MAG: TIGR00730 family Rossman fold protein [Hyphomicrobiales bacterium]|nr:TIGR00730 family Rossman fold protein [Hyphomicrobiales bacterium]